MAGAFRLNLFGVPALRDPSGSPVRLRTRKQLGLLVYLVLEGSGQGVSRDALVDLLWDTALPERGRHSLAQSLSAIRRAFGGEVFAANAEAVRFTGPIVTDLDQLSAELEGLDVAHPLAQVDGWAGAEFAHWVEAARARCLRLAAGALRAAIGAHRSAGQTARVHACAAMLSELDPLSPAAVHALAERELMRGDVVAAIRLLREHLDRVREAVGCMPHPDVERLLRRLEAGAHPPVELVPRRLAAEATRLRPALFVARERELAQLEAEWEQARAGAFRSCRVLGPGGIGKSSLVRRFAATVAARGQPAFVITCQEIGAGIPFAAISDLVTALSRDPSVAATDPKWLAEVARIHPGLRTTYPGIPEPPSAPAESVRLRVAEGVLQMVDAVADGAPVVIVFDDVPFMDPATRDVLHVLTRRLEGHRLLLLGTARMSGPEAIPRSGESLTWHTTLRLGPLPPDGTKTLIAELSPAVATTAGTVVDRIVTLSEGNPQFVEMLVADWEVYAAESLAGGRTTERLPHDWTPPDSLRQAFARLYAGLGDVARQTLHVLAVARRALGTTELGEALNRNPRSLDFTILELLDRGILRLEGGALAFKNELHRAYVYYAVSQERRKFFHAQLGHAALQRAVAGDFQEELEASHHLAKSGDFVQATRAVLRSAQVAVKTGAAYEAESVLYAVLAAPHETAELQDLLLLLAQALSAQGKYSATLKVLSQQEATDWLSRRSEALAAVLTAQALHRLRPVDDPTMIARMENAVSLARASGDDSLLAAATQVAAELASELGNAPMMARSAETSEELARASQDPDTKARALLTTAFCCMVQGESCKALDLFRTSARLYAAASTETQLAPALTGEAVCLYNTGRYPDAVRLFSHVIRLARRIRDSERESLALNNLGLVYQTVGLFPEARWCYERSMTPHATSRTAVIRHVNMAILALITGDYEAAASSISVAQDAASKSRLWRLSALADFAEADLQIAKGEPELAWPLVERAMDAVSGRERALDANGMFIRLGLHFTLVTRGVDAFSRRVSEVWQNPKPLTVDDAAEIDTFLDWVRLEGMWDDKGPRLADQRAHEMGLFGVIAALSAVGVCALSDHRRLRTESAADMIERVYPTARRSIILSHPISILDAT